MKHKSVVWDMKTFGMKMFHIERRIKLFVDDDEFICFTVFKTKKEASDL